MKKYILSFLIIGSFGFYLIYQKLGNSNNSTMNTQTKPQINGMMPKSFLYKNGSYVGDTSQTIYGPVQVKATIMMGKITDIQFLQYPQDRENSLEISNRAMPKLKTEAIIAQNAEVNIVSGATETSSGFIDSLNSALAQAKN